MVQHHPTTWKIFSSFHIPPLFNDHLTRHLLYGRCTTLRRTDEEQVSFTNRIEGLIDRYYSRSDIQTQISGRYMLYPKE
jgi:hypothetical protein